MDAEFTGEGHFDNANKPAPIGELRIYAMILAAVGVVVVSVSYVQCCFPVSIVGLALSFFAYRKSTETGNELAKNLSILGMAMAVIQMLIVIAAILLYVLYFAFLFSTLTGSLR
jgi:hypothetical protein